MTDPCYLGVDVGTGSVRAGLFDPSGKRLGQASHEIKIWRPQEDFVEQSSSDIWAACCKVVKLVVLEADVSPSSIRGIGFDGTCSLVALDEADSPVTVSPSGEDEQNVIVWMDHRAVEQADRINLTGHRVLESVGGVMSPEMQSPKLLWLKENLPETWKRSALFLDLPDFMVYRATGVDVRSLCTTVCKWTYVGHEDRWDESFFLEAGLSDLCENGFLRIGRRVRPMGEAVGSGLTREAADDLGLLPGTPVSVSIIDAHAGGIGLVGAPINGVLPTDETLGERLALIGGTSSCHMAVSRSPRNVPGVWGPYYSAMVPGLWLTEGGQSATGALIDHVIFSHVRGRELVAEAKERGGTVYDLLNDRLDELASGKSFQALLTEEVHVLPYFHGNRSPRANPNLRGMVSGLKLTDTIDSLAVLYLATIQAIAHGTRHILEEMTRGGYSISSIFACGGGTKNPVFLREHANITGCDVLLPSEPEAVLLGSAMLGAVAAGDQPDLISAMGAMSRVEKVIEPERGKVKEYHEKKHKVFLRMYEDQMAYGEILGKS